MAKTREIKGRMKAVGNIRRITRTMQLIATARFQTSQRRATAAKPYAHKIAELVGELARVAAASAGGSLDHPLLRAPTPARNRQLLLVLTSNRGLCGGYNANLLRTANAFLRETAGQQIDLEVVGKKGNAYFRYTKTPVAAFHSHFTDDPAYAEVERLADRYIQTFTDGVYDAVRVVYMAFQSAARQSPAILPLLPLQNPLDAARQSAQTPGSLQPSSETWYDLSPTPAQLLSELLPIAVKTQLLQCFNEAAVGEHIARMVAMKSATDSATKMGRELTRRYNRARQAAITTELSEIIGGSAALE
jgi:F-type H+-transporting ATPase subunit gamma